MNSSDPYDLQRFLDAQNTIYERVCEELDGGCKRSHWMWFIFPQIAGLGFSETSRFYAIRSLPEALAYLQHPVLGPRLVECTKLVTRISGKTIDDIFGSPDDLKFRSCMTLFAHAQPDNEFFERALKKYFSGQNDPRTIALLESRE